MSLIDTWLAVEAENGLTNSEALRELNKEMGTRYRINRLYEWRAGKREVPRPARDYMLRMSIYAVLLEELPYRFDRETCNDAVLDRIAARLT